MPSSGLASSLMHTNPITSYPLPPLMGSFSYLWMILDSSITLDDYASLKVNIWFSLSWWTDLYPSGIIVISY